MSYVKIYEDEYDVFKGKGFLSVILPNGTAESLAYLEVDISIKQNILSSETNKGIIKSIADNIDAEGTISLLKGIHKYWKYFVGMNQTTNTTEAVLWTGSADGTTDTDSEVKAIETGIAAMLQPSMVKISFGAEEVVSPGKIIVTGKDRFGNPLPPEEFNYSKNEVTKSLSLFSAITKIELPGTLGTAETPITVTLTAMKDVTHGLMTENPVFSMQLVLFDKETGTKHVQGVQLNNVIISTKSIKASGKNDNQTEEIKFTVQNGNADMYAYEWIDVAES